MPIVKDVSLAKVYTKLQASKDLRVLNTKLDEQSADLKKLVKSAKAEADVREEARGGCQGE